MKVTIVGLLFFLFVFNSFSQVRLEGFNQKDINPDLFQNRWDACWISVPDFGDDAYGVYHFRKVFELDIVPEKFIVHVSADNRYKLYINGHLIALGPARGDIYNWNFETVDLAPYLQEKNILAAVVWNFAEHSPIAQVSFKHTGFILQGNSEKEAIVNTNSSWRCTKSNAYEPWIKPVLGYYAAGAGESFDANKYLWDWESTNYDDSSYQNASTGLRGAMKGARDYPGRLLVPSPIPPMEMELERLKAIRISDGIDCDDSLLQGKSSVIIPPRTKVRLLLDHGMLTTGYLSLVISKGANSVVHVGYSEALYSDAVTHSKGNRNEVDNKEFIGYEDRIIADGGMKRIVTSLWWRTWRYINLTITTAEEPLVLEDIYGTTSMYPFLNETSFQTPENVDLNKILDIGWHTARLCANETYMDCPYYEQLQYFGDARIQAMITMFNTRDRYMLKNVLEQGRQSIIADGITMSRYPSGLHQFISSFSLWWICMGHDYWMYRGDEDYLKTLLPAYRGILAWYEQWLKSDYSLDYIPHWFFADWCKDFPSGEPIREENGNSAFQDLMYLYTLDNAVAMEKAFGIPQLAQHYEDIASQIRSGFREKYWNDSRGLFADTHDHRAYSQHVNSLAILTGIVTGDNAAEVMRRTLEDNSLAQVTIYFSYYLHQAMKKAGLGDLFLEKLDTWKIQMDLGLTTWAERPEPSRSDCHAWGSSPNIEFFRLVLGIDTRAPGFKEVVISPSLGNLKRASGTIPHPDGTISVDYIIDTENKLTAKISLPEGCCGTFIWKGKDFNLKAGAQVIEIE